MRRPARLGLGLAVLAGLAALGVRAALRSARGPSDAEREERARATPAGPPTLTGTPRPADEAPAPAAGGAAPQAGPLPPGGPGAWSVVGRVLLPDGAPAAGAQVEAVLERGGHLEALGATTSGPDGAYALDLPRLDDLGEAGRHFAALELTATHRPLRVGRERLASDRWSGAVPPGPLVADLWLGPQRMWRGRVVTSRGEPVAQARVRLCADGPGGDPDAPTGGRGASSGPGGWFALEAPPGRAAAVVAFSPEQGLGRREATEVSAEGDVPDVVLKDVPSVEGRVLRPDGSPLEGVGVWGELTGAEPPDDPCRTSWGQSLALSGEGGRFRLRFLREGACRLWTHESEARLNARTGDRDLSLVLDLGRLRVRIVDGQGRLLPGAGLFAFGWDPARAARLTDLLEGRLDAEEAPEDGDWSSAASGSRDGVHDLFLAAGSAVVVQSHAEGFAPVEQALTMPADGSGRELELRVRRAEQAGALRVAWRGGDGAPLPHVRVRVSSRLGSLLAERVLGPGAAIDGLPAGAVTVRLGPSGGPELQPSWVVPLTSWALEETVRVAIPAGGTAELDRRAPLGGRVRVFVEQEGAPAPVLDDEGFERWVGGPSLRAVNLLTGEAQRLMLVLRAPEGGRESVVSAAVLNRALLAATPLGVGRWRVEAHGSGQGFTSPLAAEEVEVRAGVVTDLRLRLPPRR